MNDSDKSDDRFYRTLYEKDGTPVRVLKEQLGPECITYSSGFGTYDGSHRHCAFCGRLICPGSCFK